MGKCNAYHSTNPFVLDFICYSPHTFTNFFHFSVSRLTMQFGQKHDGKRLFHSYFSCNIYYNSYEVNSCAGSCDTSLFKRVPFPDLKCFRLWWWSQRRRRMVSFKLNKCCCNIFRIYQPSYIIIILSEQAMYIGMLIIGFLLLLHL